jgi:hypothetical protein
MSSMIGVESDLMAIDADAIQKLAAGCPHRSETGGELGATLELAWLRSQKAPNVHHGVNAMLGHF